MSLTCCLLGQRPASIFPLCTLGRGASVVTSDESASECGESISRSVGESLRVGNCIKSQLLQSSPHKHRVVCAASSPRIILISAGHRTSNSYGCTPNACRQGARWVKNAILFNSQHMKRRSRLLFELRRGIGCLALGKNRLVESYFQAAPCYFQRCISFVRLCYSCSKLPASNFDYTSADILENSRAA